ncbi:hypothetical protein ACLKA7_003483 [Drosophila subpalustris]
MSAVSYSLKSSKEFSIDADQPKGLPSALYNNSLRTQVILLDYKQFKAARSIQKFFRGWQVRNLMEKRRKSAILIQRKWRRFIARRHLEIVAQDRAQEAILIMFENSSVKIQALFRGWWSRKHLHNFLFLESMQTTAVQELLNCMARKLLEIKRNASLPGILSFCDQGCLSKVEDLLSTLSYRMYNSIVAKKSLVTKTNLNRKKEEYKNSKSYTWVPFNGLDCDRPPNWDVVIKSYDHNQQDFANSFVKAQRLVQEIKQRPQAKGSQMDTKKPSQLISVKQQRFCEKMMYKIRKYSVFQEHNLNLSDSLTDVRISEFLDIVKGYLETYNYLENCYCKSDPKRSCPLK